MMSVEFGFQQCVLLLMWGGLLLAAYGEVRALAGELKGAAHGKSIEVSHSHER